MQLVQLAVRVASRLQRQPGQQEKSCCSSSPPLSSPCAALSPSAGPQPPAYPIPPGTLPPAQAGDKIKAMKALLRSGDTEKIVFFTGACPDADTSMMGCEGGRCCIRVGPCRQNTEHRAKVQKAAKDRKGACTAGASQSAC